MQYGRLRPWTSSPLNCIFYSCPGQGEEGQRPPTLRDQASPKERAGDGAFPEHHRHKTSSSWRREADVVASVLAQSSISGQNPNIGCQDFNAIQTELVASFANRLNLLKYGEKTSVYTASLPMGRTSKRCSDHAHFVLHAATACRAFI
jgi:hypothetical protein